jgi:threonine/homoserine/homoserine lactone efflux protein
MPLPEWPLLAAFISASLLLAVTPGPGVLYIVGRSLAQGRGAGLASVAGVALGNLANALIAAFGLSALFAISALAFDLVRFAGAAYLVYLGLRFLREPVAAQPGLLPPVRLRRLFGDGLLVALLNPKTTLFFAAFLPQFMSHRLPLLPQSIALGSLFVAVALVTDSVYALAAGSIAPTLARVGRAMTAGRRLLGLALIGLGLFAALSGSQDKPRAR